MKEGPYAAARVGLKPATLLMQGTELSTEPPRPTPVFVLSLMSAKKLPWVGNSYEAVYDERVSKCCDS